ncbi:MAG: hypothetical protein KC493_04765 [Bacteriovoracaceae bacterium]|nr:hypothetical protein [Bacteriovoracaceae bacterium]
MKKSVFTLLTLLTFSMLFTSCGTSSKSNTFKAPNGDSTSSSKTGQFYYSEWFESRKGAH